MNKGEVKHDFLVAYKPYCTTSIINNTIFHRHISIDQTEQNFKIEMNIIK